MLVPKNRITTLISIASGETSRTYDGSVSSSLSGLGFLTSVLLHFVGEFASRRFGLGPLGGGLPSLIGSVGSRLDWFLGRHGMKVMQNGGGCR